MNEYCTMNFKGKGWELWKSSSIRLNETLREYSQHTSTTNHTGSGAAGRSQDMERKGEKKKTPNASQRGKNWYHRFSPLLVVVTWLLLIICINYPPPVAVDRQLSFKMKDPFVVPLCVQGPL